VSGVDVTIPFTLSDNAATAVEVLSSEIVISAGQLTGSITISTTEELDDDDVEILEPIIFTFGTITNATTDITDITLNLESDDDPTITAFGTTGDITSQVEDGFFEITASINSASSSDVTVPLALEGDAIFDQDYSIDFQTKGEQTTLLDLGTQSFGKMNLLPDGRLLYITNFDGWKLRFYNPTTQLWTVKDFNPQEYIETNPVQVFSNTEVYSISGSRLIKIDFSNLEDILITTVFDGGNGETIGSITINGLDDDLYEFTESLIVQAGTPVNGIFSDNLITEGVANPVALELTDNDALSEVTYAFSSPTIQEFPYEDVTLTATLSAISGVDVTIPFTLSDNASTAVEVLSTEIVVLAGQQTGSITVSTTEDLDDDVVEILEPIVFTFGTISNATSEVTDITLNLESDDDPTITAIGTTGDVISQVEDGSFEITASIDLPTSKEVTIPFTLSGDAIFNEDYTVSFDSEGEKSVIYDSGSQSFGK
jgi:hypothetical protein